MSNPCVLFDRILHTASPTGLREDCFMRTIFVVLALGTFLCAICCAQDPTEQSAAPQPSLGEIARQVRLKKQQREAQLAQAKAKQAPDSNSQSADATPTAPPPKTAHLVTNDETPERASVTPAAAHEPTSAEPDADKSAGDHAAQAENWKSQIVAQKNEIAALQQDITNLSNSIHFAGGNCVANCAQWNERQQQKQQEVETMKAQLEQQQKRLEEMQETARKAGFGSSVYDP